MDRASGGVPDDFNEGHDAEMYEHSEQGEQFRRCEDFEDFGEYEAHDEEPLRKQLAHFAFVREEDDREVRLTFRDVPADEIAKAFRGSGALLISMMGERALAPPAVSVRPESGWTDLDANGQEAIALQSRKRRTHRTHTAEGVTASARPNRTTGELTMRYFFSLGDLVYTINIASPTGIVESIAGIFPSAAQSERELQSRLAVVFREIRN